MLKDNLHVQLQLSKEQLHQKLQSALADTGLSNSDVASIGVYIRCGTEGVCDLLKRGAAEQWAEKCRARAQWIAAATLLLIALVSFRGPLPEPGRVIDSQRQLIEPRKRIRHLDGEMQVRETEEADNDERVKEAGLLASEKAVLRSGLDAASPDLKRVDEQKTEAEKRALTETQAKEVVLERAANMHERVSEPRRDLEETQEKRDTRQLDDRDQVTEKRNLLIQQPSIQPPIVNRASSGSVLTQHNDSMRTGAYLLETRLTPANVARGLKLHYSRPVNGTLTAQLLYEHGVRMNSKARNVIYAFTDQNVVYAYDADEERESGTSRGLLWTRSLPATPSTALPFTAPGADIRSTPVIDESSGTLYLVYAICNGLFPTDGLGDGNPLYEVEYHLAALGLRSGAVLKDRVVSGSVSSSVVPGHVDFVPARQTQSAGLLLLRNPLNKGERTVYVAFGARWREETHNYHGWLMGYDAKTFAPRGVFCTTPNRQMNDEGGGIWQGGAGPAGDQSGNVYFNTGHGTASGNEHGNSIVKLSPVLRGGKYDFNVQAFSAEADDPAHAKQWRFNHIDLGEGGVTVIPDSSRLVSGGRTGVLYLMDRSTMTKILSFEAFTVDPTNDLDPEDARFRDWGHGPHLHGAWTYWAVSRSRGYVYHWAEKDFLRRFDYDPTTGQINPASVIAGDVLAKPYPVMPGGLISLSANGTKDGVLWVTLPWDKDSGRIMAFDALTLRRLWDTTVPADALTSDNSPATVADGKVIVGTKNGNFLVYALANPPAAAPKVQTSANPRAAMQPSVTADPNLWMRGCLRRLEPAKAHVLNPPKGHRPLFFATGSSKCHPGPPGPDREPDKGLLTYEVQRTDRAPVLQWVLIEVSGQLCDDSGVMPQWTNGGRGFALAAAQSGLAWKKITTEEEQRNALRDQVRGPTSQDGVVQWSVEASVEAPRTADAAETRDAPWVLFRSEPSTGHDLFDEVTYVQLVSTVGGAPPPSVGKVGEQKKVPYTGRYVFYVRNSTGGTHTPSH